MKLTQKEINSFGGAKVPVTIGTGIPDEWKVEHGYAEWKNPTYTNPRFGERVHVMPSSSSAWSELAGRKGEVVTDAYSSLSSTLLDVRFDDGETRSVSNQVLMREGDKCWARLMPGTDAERMTFHYLSGKPAPANRCGEAGEQFNYKPRGKQADRALQVSALTGGGV